MHGHKYEYQSRSPGYMPVLHRMDKQEHGCRQRRRLQRHHIFQSIQYDRSIRRWSIVKCQSYHFLISIYGTVDSTIFICVVQTVTDSEFSGFNHSGCIGIVPFVTCLEFSGLDHACCICIVGRISNLKQSGFKDT